MGEKVKTVTMLLLRSHKGRGGGRGEGGRSSRNLDYVVKDCSSNERSLFPSRLPPNEHFAFPNMAILAIMVNYLFI